RRQDCAHRSLIDASTARDIGRSTEMTRINETVVGCVGLVEHRKLIGMLRPRKIPAVDDDATQRCSVATHEFGQRVHDYVGAVTYRTYQNRSGHCVVHDQWDAVLMRNTRQRFDIADVACRITHALAVNRSRVLVYELLHCGGVIGLGETNSNPETRKDVSKKSVGSTVELRNR